VAFVYVLAAGVLVTGLIHLAVGWAFASGLHEAAFAVRDRPPELGVWVRAVTTTSITLQSDGPRQDIGHPGKLGASWNGGYGYVGDVVDVQGSIFVRPFQLAAGTLPPTCEDFECEPIALDPWYYPTDPHDLGLDFDTVTFTTGLGEMTAWEVPADGDRWAVMVHGWTAEKREFLRMLPTFHAAGVNSLVMNYRNDAGMPRDPGGLHRFGLTEWPDVASAIEHLNGRHPGGLILFGCSTGAALIMRCLERMAPVDIRAVVFDAPNIMLAETIRHGTTDLRSTPLMREVGLWLADLRWKVDWDTTNFVARAEAILTMPTLVFHGTSDLTVPISVSRHLAARLPGIVELIETTAAGHVMSWNADPERYQRYLGGFLERL
jgi:hypothetical protein